MNIYAAFGIVLYENSAQMAQIFMIYAAEEPERSGVRRSQMAKICANHKNLRHLRAKKQIAAFDRAIVRWGGGCLAGAPKKTPPAVAGDVFLVRRLSD